eukprot:GHVS01073162.1.p1 GENE.GHVS01073162.1~~GHVS01073162.1.p1  ORF type:complete len:228 (+),score=17.99 GHVS01073162.1:70-753(+)
MSDNGDTSLFRLSSDSHLIVYASFIYLVVDIWCYLRFRRLRSWLQRLSPHRPPADIHYLQAVLSQCLTVQTPTDLYKFLQYSFFSHNPADLSKEFVAQWLQSHVNRPIQECFPIVSLLETQTGLTLRSPTTGTSPLTSTVNSRLGLVAGLNVVEDMSSFLSASGRADALFHGVIFHCYCGGGRGCLSNAGQQKLILSQWVEQTHKRCMKRPIYRGLHCRAHVIAVIG